MIPKHFNAMIHVERISLWSKYFMDTTHKIYFRTSYILGSKRQILRSIFMN